MRRPALSTCWTTCRAARESGARADRRCRGSPAPPEACVRAGFHHAVYLAQQHAAGGVYTQVQQLGPVIVVPAQLRQNRLWHPYLGATQAFHRVAVDAVREPRHHTLALRPPPATSTATSLPARFRYQGQSSNILAMGSVRVSTHTQPLMP